MLSCLILALVGSTQCSGRFTDPSNPNDAYVEGPARLTRSYTGLTIVGDSATIHGELCFATQHDCAFENRIPFGVGRMDYTNLGGHITIEVNGRVISGDLLTTNVTERRIAPYDGFTDFTGPSGRFIQTEPVATLGTFDLAIPIDEIDLWRNDFDVTVTMIGIGSTEASSSPATGSVGFRWRGGLVFNVQ